ncbi:MAG: AtpZ/AtpI family protein, partial [Rhodospirillales bacterium]|nr:AtpZ/AtpI family protein [Rhodospirillales bacterium]
MTDERDNSPPSDDLTERIRAARERERVERQDTERSGRARVSGLGLGFRIAIEMVAGVLVGAGLGY